MESWLLLFIVLGLSVLFLFKKVRTHTTPTVTDLIVYPIKSCAGVHLLKAKMTESGLYLDRAWAIVDVNWKVVTAREDPRLWNIRPSLDLGGDTPPSELVLKYESDSVKIDLSQPLERRFELEIEYEKAAVADQGSVAADWLKKTLLRNYRLCRIFAPRKSENPNVPVPPDTVLALQDTLQLLVVSQASFQAVHTNLPSPKKNHLKMSCFRPNIVVTGVNAFDEDTWAKFRIGDIPMIGVGACDRCRMTTIDPKSLVFDEKLEPLMTLRRIRGSGVKACFGQWSIGQQPLQGEKVLRVGDKVVIEERKQFRP